MTSQKSKEIIINAIDRIAELDFAIGDEGDGTWLPELFQACEKLDFMLRCLAIDPQHDRSLAQDIVLAMKSGSKIYDSWIEYFYSRR